MLNELTFRRILAEQTSRRRSGQAESCSRNAAITLFHPVLTLWWFMLNLFVKPCRGHFWDMAARLGSGIQSSAHMSYGSSLPAGSRARSRFLGEFEGQLFERLPEHCEDLFMVAGKQYETRFLQITFSSLPLALEQGWMHQIQQAFFSRICLGNQQTQEDVKISCNQAIFEAKSWK